MKVKYLDLSTQYNSIQNEAEQIILDILKSGNYCMGKYVSDFEEKFAKYCGAKIAVACNSGTSA